MKIWRFIKNYWNIFIGIASAITICIAAFMKEPNEIALSISISIFASWLIFFLADFLPTKIKERKAFAFVKPKLKSIFDEINHIEDVLCFYVNISVDKKVEEKADLIKHIFSIDSIRVCEEIFYNPENPLRLNHDIGANTINGCTTKIFSTITEIEKFWSYLPIELVKSIEIIRENCGLKDCMNPINAFFGTLKGVLPQSENQVLKGRYEKLINETKTLEKYGCIRIERIIKKDERTEEEKNIEIAKALTNIIKDKK